MASFSHSRLAQVGEGRDPLLNALPLAAAIVNWDGTIRAANPMWLESWPTATPGESYLRFCEELHGSPDAQVGAGVRAVLAGRAREFHCNIVPGPGAESGPIRISAVPYGGDGSGCVMLLQQPMHQPEQPEEDAQWRQSRKLETVGRMVGSVAHDFANLLTLIAGYSERLLKRVSERDPLRGELDEIRKAASRGSRLTAGLLSFARGQSVEPRQLDLNALIVGLESMLRPIAGERIELEMRLPPDLGAVVADPGQMEQVIVNLVLNARDAMPDGGRLVIETSNREIGEQEAREHSAEPGPAIQLSVTDTGHGMDAGTLERLFDPFFTTKDKGRGTGLGLSTVRSIVRESRGQVWAVSVPGHGAVFTVWLPRMRPAPAAHLAALPRRPGAVAGGDETILLVEDEENVRRLLRHVLETRGYRVLEAPHAEGALRLFEQRPGDIDLLLTDMVLPRMSGRELAERARTIRPGLEVIYMSGYADDDLMRTGAFGPGISILEKPLRPDVLEACVREALDHRARVDSQAG